MMKKYIYSLILVVVITPWANAEINDKLPLNRVFLDLQEEHWVTTDSADVIVSIDATVARTELAKIRAQIMDNLQNLARGEWYITAFRQHKDESGLERLSVTAEARIEDSQLNQLNEKASEISKPGTTFRIATIEFVPSTAEIEQVKNELRKKIYARVNEELVTLNEFYSDQEYVLHELEFEFSDTQLPYAKTGFMQRMAMESYQDSAEIAVSNRLQIFAAVTLAAYYKD